jgi:hypothetical protein
MRYIGLSEPWSIRTALEWRHHQQPLADENEAASELLRVCSSGHVRMRGTRRYANPLWPDDRKVAVRFQAQQEEWIPVNELVELYFDLKGNYDGGSLNWLSSRKVAWWPVEFACDDLVKTWLSAITPISPPNHIGEGFSNTGASGLRAHIFGTEPSEMAVQSAEQPTSAKTTRVRGDASIKQFFNMLPLDQLRTKDPDGLFETYKDRYSKTPNAKPLPKNDRKLKSKFMAIRELRLR